MLLSVSRLLEARWGCPGSGVHRVASSPAACTSLSPSRMESLYTLHVREFSSEYLLVPDTALSSLNQESGGCCAGRWGPTPVSGPPFSPVLPLKTIHLEKKAPGWVLVSVTLGQSLNLSGPNFIAVHERTGTYWVIYSFVTLTHA